MNDDLKPATNSMPLRETTVPSGPVALYISTVRDANLLILDHSKPCYADYRRDIAAYILNPENEVYGSTLDYIHVIDHLFDCGDLSTALKVCDYVLASGPPNASIISAALNGCSRVNQFSRGEKYLNMAEAIPVSFWHYNLLQACIDFLTCQHYGVQTEDLYRRALHLADEYIRHFPYDELGYKQAAWVMTIMNRYDEAIEKLKHAIFEVQPDPNNRDSSLVCPQCCLSLLRLLESCNDYDFIISICDTGLRHATLDFSYADIGYFMYRKALALDAKAYHESFRVNQTVIMALRCYQAAYDMNRGDSWQRIIEQRFAALKAHAVDIAYTQPLYKRPLAVDEAALAPRQ